MIRNFGSIPMLQGMTNQPTAKDDGLVEQVEGQHGLVGVGQHLVVEIEVFCAQAQA